MPLSAVRHKTSAMQQLINLASKLKIKSMKRVHRPARRKGAARPMKSLSMGYKGLPNQYRFSRETRPITVDFGAAGLGVSLIAGTGAIPNTSVLKFPSFSIDTLPNFTEFSALFASYKIDKISLICIPMWSQQNQQNINPLTGGWAGTAAVPNLMLTRVNTKYLTNGYTLPATAEANRDKLAQIMKKTRSLYGSKKWMKVITRNPLVWEDLDDGGGGTNLVTKRSPWLPTATGADQLYSQNDIIFADRLDGTDFIAGIYKYRYYYKIDFRCSFVG